MTRWFPEGKHPGAKALGLMLLMAVGLGVLVSMAGFSALLTGMALLAGVVAFTAVWAHAPMVWLALSLGLYAIVQNLLEQYRLSVQGMEINLAQVLGLGILLLLLVRLGQRGLRFPKYPTWWAAAFVMSLGVGLVRTHWWGISVAAVLRTVTVLATFFFAAVLSRDRRHYVWVRGAVMFSALLASGVLVLDFLRGGQEVIRQISVGPQRAGGLFGRPNISADVAMLAIPALVSFLHEKRGLTGGRITSRQWIFAVGGILLCALGLFASFTRSNILAVLLFTLFYLHDKYLFSGQRSRVNRVAVIAIIALSIPIAIHLVGEGAVEARLQDLPGISGKNLTDPTVGSGRMMIWGALVKRLPEMGLVGFLFGGGLWKTLDVTQAALFIGRAAHNSYLELLWNQGIIGLGAYLAFYLTVLKLMGRCERGGGGILPDLRIWRHMIVAFMLTGEMFTTTCYALASRWYLMATAGVLLGICAHAQRTAAAEGVGATEASRGTGR